MARIPKRKLGNTGLEVTVLGFGASTLGGVFQDIDEDAGVAAVHRAFELGINFFDTSPFYGITKSETVLGRGLRDLPRDQIVVATKVGRYGAEDFDFSAERVTRSVQESLGRLHVDYIDLIQCHDIEFTHLDQIVNETLPALQKLKQQGLVRHIGITGLPLKIFKYVLDRVPEGTVETVLSYCHYTLNDKSLGAINPYLQAKGVGIINASALSMGLLTPQGPPEWHPAPAELKATCAAAAAHAQSRGVSIAELAISEAVKDEATASVLVGLTTPAQVEQNVQTVLRALGLAENPGRTLEAEVLGEVQQILQPTLGVTWPSGLPENN